MSLGRVLKSINGLAAIHGNGGTDDRELIAEKRVAFASNEDQESRELPPTDVDVDVDQKRSVEELARHLHDQLLKKSVKSPLVETDSESCSSQSSGGTFVTKVKLVLPHVLLIAATACYIVFGAVVFFSIEQPHERQIKAQYARFTRQKQIKFLEEVWRNSSGVVDTEEAKIEWAAIIDSRFDELIESTFEAFRVGVRAQEIVDGAVITVNWDFLSAVFFSTTVITTVGYGHLVPATFWGRCFCIAYALFGIPLALVTVADFAKFLSAIITDVYKRLLLIKTRLARCCCFCSRLRGCNRRNDEEIGVRSDSVFSDSITNVSVLFVLLILMVYTTTSALLYSACESAWSFLDAFYFSLITMVTIGFGDLVPSRLDSGRELYLLASIAFIFCGLVLTTMCIDLVGTDYIERIHYFGRKIGSAKQALALLQDRFLLRRYLRWKADRMLDSSFWLLAYRPPDMHRMNYIDDAAEAAAGQHQQQQQQHQHQQQHEVV